MSELFKQPTEATIYDLIWVKGEGQKIYRLTAANALVKDRNKVLIEEFGYDTCIQKVINRSDIERVVGAWCS